MPADDRRARALVTGAGRGLGRHLALGLARHGWDVALVGRTRATLDVVAAEVAGTGGVRSLVLPTDVADADAVRATVAAVEEAWGGVDLLVNNAGVLEQREVPFLDDDVEDVWRVVVTNVRGPLLVTHAVLPAMLRRGGGRIVNISSGAAHRPSPAHTGYGLSKGALSRLTLILHAQYHEAGISTFDLAPGVVDTDMTRSMPVWEGKTDWTPPERSVELLRAIGAGELDALSGRFLRADIDTVADLVAATEAIVREDARVLRVPRYGPADPLLP